MLEKQSDNSETFISYTAARIDFRNTLMALNSLATLDTTDKETCSIIMGNAHIRYIDEIRSGLKAITAKVTGYAKRYVEHTIPYIFSRYPDNYDLASFCATYLGEKFNTPFVINGEYIPSLRVKTPQKILFDELENSFYSRKLNPQQKEYTARIILELLSKNINRECSMVEKVKGIKNGLGASIGFKYSNYKYVDGDIMLIDSLQNNSVLNTPDGETYNELWGYRKINGLYVPIVKNFMACF